MARSVHVHPATWLDRHFKKAFDAAAPAEQAAIQTALVDFTTDLMACSCPATAPEMRSKWGAKAYQGVIKSPRGHLIEYCKGFPGLMRVIAFYVTDKSSPRYGAVLLLTITLVHDHDRMKTLIKNNKASINELAASAGEDQN